MDGPTDDQGRPVCARPCQDNEPCFRRVPIPGAACHDHEQDQEILPLPDDIPEWDVGQSVDVKEKLDDS